MYGQVTPEALLREVGLENQEYLKELYASKELKYAIGRSITAIPVVIEKTEDKSENHTFYYYTIEVHVFEHNTYDEHIHRHVILQDTVHTDATGPRRIVIDNAPYNIRTGSRATGIRIEYYSKSWDWFLVHELILLEPKAATWIEVMKVDAKKQWQSRGMGCASDGQIISSTYEIDHTRFTNDYHPIIEKATYKRYNSIEDCDAPDTSYSVQIINELVFLDSVYQYYPSKKCHKFKHLGKKWFEGW